MTYELSAVSWHLQCHRSISYELFFIAFDLVPYTLHIYHPPIYSPGQRIQTIFVLIDKMINRVIVHLL